MVIPRETEKGIVGTMPIRLDYIANMRLPTEKAHGVQIMKTCEAFARTGTEVRLIVPTRTSAITENPFQYYGIEKQFPITRTWSLDVVSWGSLGFRLQSLTFALAALRHIHKEEILYGRDEMVLWLINRFRQNEVVWESHTGAWNYFARVVARRAKKIIVISQGLKDFYIARGIDKEKIFVAHDGVDLVSFEHTESKEESRRRLGLPLDKKIAMYIGRLDGWKGINTLLEASTLFIKETQLVVIGGEPSQVTSLQKKYPHVLFLGFLPYRDIANNQAAADVLILPNTALDTTSLRYTSPLKLFTYMASGRPIVASDLPSIREVVSEHEAYLVEPDSPQALADGVLRALSTGDAPVRAEAACKKVNEYTWDTRAEHILSCIH